MTNGGRSNSLTRTSRSPWRSCQTRRPTVQTLTLRSKSKACVGKRTSLSQLAVIKTRTIREGGRKNCPPVDKTNDNGENTDLTCATCGKVYKKRAWFLKHLKSHDGVGARQSSEQINIREQIPKYLNSQAKLLTTRCIIIETEKLAKKTHGALTILKQYGIHECGHKEPIGGANCIMAMIGKRNDKHYILATQDRDLQENYRQKAGVPLLYLHNKSPTLDKPSKNSYAKAGQSLETVFISETQNEALESMKKAFGLEENREETKVPIKKKKLHTPNPLSCRKKKKKPVKDNKVQKDSVREGKVRKRKKRKLPEHVKEQLKSLASNG